MSENPKDPFDVDLFGAPAEQIKDRWGRPSFRKTPENQRLVAMLRGAGWTQGRIAAYIGTSEKTLRKNFSRELTAGADLIEGDALAVLLTKMRQGNNVATKMVLEALEKGRAKLPQGAQAAAQDEDEDEAAPVLGKKARLKQEAQKPKGSWGFMEKGRPN